MPRRQVILKVSGSRTPSWPYRLHCSILYGQFDWLTRHPGGMVTVPMSTIARELRLTPQRVRAYLTQLANIGLLDHYAQHHDYALVRAVPPLGMARVVTEPSAATVDVVAEVAQ